LARSGYCAGSNGSGAHSRLERGQQALSGGVAVATVAVGLVGTGVAHADVSFSVPTPTGLVDGGSVAIHLAGINAIALAAVEVSECGNAYADTTALPTLVPAKDCVVLARINVSTTPTLDTSVVVTETGIGLGNRSCILAGNFSCDLRITQMTNQGTSPLPTPVPISFASDPASSSPRTTTTTASVIGAPVAVGKPAYARIVVSTVGNLTPEIAEGNVAIDFDGVQVANQPIGADGSLTIPLGAPAHGAHTLDAHFAGDGSFAASNASSSPFSVINATNISVGDVTVVEGNAGFGKIAIPVVLSQQSLLPVTVHFTLVPGSATAPSDYTAGQYSGNIKFRPGSTIHNVIARIKGDTIAEGNETFSLVLSAPLSPWELRRTSGLVTILDDDTSPTGPAVSVGDASIPEGDQGPTHLLRFPLTLSEIMGGPVIVDLTLSSGTSVHRTPRTPGDWAGKIRARIKFLPGQVRKNVVVIVFPDMVDEQNLTLFATINAVTASVPVGVNRASGTATILSDE